MHKYTAVLFDFDGTLAYTARDVWESVRHGFAKHGLELPESYAASDCNLAYTVPEMIRQLYPEVSEETAMEVERAVTQHYRYENTYSYTQLYRWIQEILDMLLREGIPTGILSNKGQLSLERILLQKGWVRYFTSFRGTRDLEDELRPKVYRLREYIQEFDTSDALYIGDSAGDIEAARENHIHSVGVLYGDGDSQRLICSSPDVLCEEPEDLLNFFKKG